MANRAVIYCRVSTEDEMQLNALEKQIAEAKQAVCSNGWKLVGQYVDEGKSGTMTKQRKEYNRLVRDMETNQFEIIVIKSQDRLMRSTKDWYLFVDKLIQNRKRLYFYLENKFYSSDDALITGIKAILAEEYSRELSKKINNAHRNRQKNKGSVLITSNTWGYDKVGKEVVINEKEAEIVRQMFQMCADGYGTRTIAKALTNQGIFSRTGNPFNDGTIRRILRNPLFKGTYVMNKKHYDFNTKRTLPVEKEYWIEKTNGVPAIVDQDLWEKANREMDRKTKISQSGNSAGKQRGFHWGNHPFSGKIHCGLCGNTFWRTQYQRTNGERVVNWCCCEYVRNGRKTHDSMQKNRKVKADRGCDNIHLKNEDLEGLLTEIANGMFRNKEKLLEEAVKIIKEVLKNTDQELLYGLQEAFHSLSDKRQRLLDKYLDGIIAEDVYLSKDTAFSEQEKKLKEEMDKTVLEQKKSESIDDRIRTILSEAEKMMNGEIALALLCQHLQSVCVYPEKLVISYDRFPKTEVVIHRINYRRMEFSVAV